VWLLDNFNYGIKWFIEGVQNGDWFKIGVGGGFVIVGIIAIKYLFAAVDDLNKDLRKEPPNKVIKEVELSVKNVKVEGDYKNTSLGKAGDAEGHNPLLPQRLCPKCGHTGFDYDRYWKEYTCKNCGWQFDEPRVNRNTTHKSKTESDSLACPQCGAKYHPNDYRAAAEVWLCSSCKNPLPKMRQ